MHHHNLHDLPPSLDSAPWSGQEVFHHRNHAFHPFHGHSHIQIYHWNLRIRNAIWSSIQLLGKQQRNVLDQIGVSKHLGDEDWLPSIGRSIATTTPTIVSVIVPPVALGRRRRAAHGRRVPPVSVRRRRAPARPPLVVPAGRRREGRTVTAIRRTF